MSYKTTSLGLSKVNKLNFYLENEYRVNFMKVQIKNPYIHPIVVISISRRVMLLQNVLLLKKMSQPQPWACNQGKGVARLWAKREAQESHHMLPRVQRVQRVQRILILIVHPKSYIHPTPLTLPFLYFGFCPQNPSKMRIFYIPLNMCFPYDNFVIPIYTQTSGSVFMFCSAFLISSPTNSICGFISKCCILDISSFSAGIASTFSCS